MGTTSTVVIAAYLHMQLIERIIWDKRKYATPYGCGCRKVGFVVNWAAALGYLSYTDACTHMRKYNLRIGNICLNIDFRIENIISPANEIECTLFGNSATYTTVWLCGACNTIQNNKNNLFGVITRAARCLAYGRANTPPMSCCWERIRVPGKCTARPSLMPLDQEPSSVVARGTAAS